MIKPKEIDILAGKNKVRPTQIEKDYVLTWVLFGISKNKLLVDNLAFKGGTVLKKVYFEDYRYSEDLDFTILDETISNEILRGELDKVYAFIKEEANITLQFKESNTHESGSINFFVNFIGPLAGNLESKDLKIDITRGEKLEFPVKALPIIITYSDLAEHSFKVKCYSLSEILIEKMAALMGRLEPRDLYDFWYLMENERLKMKDHSIEFESKAINKGHKPHDFAAKVLAKEYNLKQAWTKKLAHQMPDLPKFEDIFREAKRHFKSV